MRVGVVGANSQVGTELCFLMRQLGADVVPIVRNKVAASTFNHFEFKYRVADVSTASDARQALDDLDVVAIAAYAPFRLGNPDPQDARTTNTNLVKHAVKHTPPDASVVYFSSIAAFGSDIRSSRSDWNWYTRENRRLEELICETTDGTPTEGFAFRLGHVFGEYQGVVQDFRETLSTSQPLSIDCDPAAPSNVLHTVTLADAILRTDTREFNGGRYSVVNAPQWTWREVVDFYKPDNTTVEYLRADSSADTSRRLRTVPKRALITVLSRLPVDTYSMLTVAPFLPRRLTRSLHQSLQEKDVASGIDNYENRFRWHRSEFDDSPIPGPYLPELRQTTELLSELEAVGFLQP